MNYYEKLILIISGPTASGKSLLSEKISSYLPIEILNADVGQFYLPFSIGTAKPDWKKQKVKHHLFDVLNEPKDLSVVLYKKLLTSKIKDIWAKNKIPVLVGGSLFYLKSLFYPPKVLSKHKIRLHRSYTNNDLWSVLNKIDPLRAKNLHPNDLYRIQRALDIWEKTGIRPSKLKPSYFPFFNSIFIYINLDKKILNDRIEKRLKIMLDNGWIDEVRNFIGTPWENFFDSKGLIGYKEIADWILHGEKTSQFNPLVDTIKNKTKQYAKKQRTFWNNFKYQLEVDSKNGNFFCKIKELKSNNYYSLDLLKSYLLKEIKFFVADN